MSIELNVQETTLDQSIKAEQSGELLLAVTGLTSALLKDKIKVNDTIYNKAVLLPKQIAKQCKQFLEDSKFKSIALNLEKIDFLDMQEKILKTQDVDWLTKIIENVPEDMKMSYSMAFQNALKQLKLIIPRLPVSITSSKTRPSDFDLARFNRAYRTVSTPLTILDDLEMGCLSRSQVSTLISTYPNLYQLIKESIMAAAIEITSKDPEFQVPYNKMKQVSVFMLSNVIPADLQMLLQSNFAIDAKQQEQQAKKQTPNVAKDEMTAAQKLQNK